MAGKSKEGDCDEGREIGKPVQLNDQRRSIDARRLKGKQSDGRNDPEQGRTGQRKNKEDGAGKNEFHGVTDPSPLRVRKHRGCCGPAHPPSAQHTGPSSDRTPME